MSKKNFVGNFIGGNAKVGNCVTIINGKVVSGSGNVTIIDGQTIIDGRVVGEDFGNNNNAGNSFKARNFDEKKEASLIDIEDVRIQSPSIPITVISSDKTDKVEAHLTGEACVNADSVDLWFERVKNNLLIYAEITGICFNSNLKLDITLPNKFANNLNIRTTSADIVVDESVKVANLGVATVSGDLTINADFYQGRIITTSGDIDCRIEATRDFMATLHTVSGDISAEFVNVKMGNISAETISGRVVKHNKACRDGYNAIVWINSTSGNIKVR